VPGQRTTLTTLAIALALAAGCGDDDESGRTETFDAARVLTVVADEYSYDPETIVVTGANGRRAELRLELKNEGALAHDLRVERDGDDVGGTPIFQGGRTRRVQFPLDAGEYEIFCSVGNHRELGMEGSLTVR
jgi:plastocyanin